MSGPAWYKRNPVDHLSEVQGLGPAEIGTFSVLIDMIFARGGPVAADIRHLAGLLGCSTRLARGLVNRLIAADKIQLVGDHWTCVCVEKQVESIAKWSRNLAEAGASGGRTTAENNARARKNNNLNVASLKHLDKDKDQIRESPPRAGATGLAAGRLSRDLRFLSIGGLGQGPSSDGRQRMSTSRL